MPGNNEPARLRETSTSRNTPFNLYHEVWDGVLDIGQNVRNPQRGMVRKHFYAYVEAYEQTAHDVAMDALCAGDHRPRHRGRVDPENDEGVAYYRTHGQMAAIASAAEMQVRWNAANTARLEAETELGRANAGLGQATPQNATRAARRVQAAQERLDEHDAAVFDTNRAYPLGVQAVRQDNGYCYEITLWYRISEIYVSFHCYPG